ncbi:uncharacterized protein LOC141660760 [Apium graveolens]|uniref:uncharacterized protein LOC141660760 n=1 Tax=Apium graveolens TaxID=4045 RepID=UPI003D7BD049
MIISESFQVAAVIEKLPPAWKMFKNYLKHKRKEMTMENLILRLRIEEVNRGSEKKTNVATEKANMVEHVERSKPKKATYGKGAKLAPKGGISKSKFQGKCYIYDKVDHRSSYCRNPKKGNKKKEANMVDHIFKEMGDIDLCATISEVNLVGSNPPTSIIESEGTVILKMTSGKNLKLKNVLYVPDIHKNLVSRSLLNKHGFRIVIESDKVVLSKSGNEPPTTSKRAHESIMDNNEGEESEDEIVGVVRRIKRQHTEKSYGSDFMTYLLEEGDPKTYKESNHTWELVDLPNGCKPLGSKWVFKKKLKADGTIDKYKARLVIKRYKEQKGLDYFDTYSPVTRITSIRMMFAIAAMQNLVVHQMDVKIAFLNGDIYEEIYMEQPEGFVVPGQERKVCRLVKSLYIKENDNGYVMMILYVDDLLIARRNDKVIKSTKDMLKATFDMKDMGLANVILRIQISRTSEGLALSQPHYVEKILEKYLKDDLEKARTPIDMTLHISKNKGVAVSQLEYSRIIGSLIKKALKSMSGYVFTLAGATISLKSSKQTVITHSMSEAEFVELDKCVEQVENLCQFLEDIPGWPNPVTAIGIH